jgi:sodium pump decarboxylase gamma subunit
MNEGLELMMAGMTVVFLFLSIMVSIMYGAAAILKKFEKPEEQTPGGNSSDSQNDGLAEIAVAIAAVKAHTRG